MQPPQNFQATDKGINTIISYAFTRWWLYIFPLVSTPIVLLSPLQKAIDGHSVPLLAALGFFVLAGMILYVNSWRLDTSFSFIDYIR